MVNHREVKLPGPFSIEIVPFEDAASEEYARVRAELETSGSPIGPNDLIIAATVCSEEGTLVTRNTREFRRVEGLELVDWTEPGISADQNM